MRVWPFAIRCGAAASLSIVLGGCADQGGSASRAIGPEGGVIASADGVLTITLQPDALEEPTEIWVEASDDPPDGLGPAYSVLPTIELQRPAVVTYRHILPADLEGVAVATIDADDYAAGRGHWRPLPTLAVDLEPPSIKARDERLSLYYGLVDD